MFSRLATREARAALAAMLERFRQDGADAEPVVIGARRRPEAVVLSTSATLQLAGGRERVAAALGRQTREAGAPEDRDAALELANSELHAMRSQRRARDRSPTFTTTDRRSRAAQRAIPVCPGDTDPSTESTPAGLG